MMVELVFFISLPIFRELKVWFERRDEISRRSKGAIAALLLLGFIFIGMMPLERTIDIPAVLHAGAYSRFYPPIPARIDFVGVKEGQRVKKGDMLFVLSSPDLDYNIKLVAQRLKALEDVRDSSQANLGLMKKRVTVDSEISKTREELNGYNTLKEQLTIHAAFDGVVRDLDNTLRVGRWVGRESQLAVLVDDSLSVLSGYVSEHDVSRLADGNHGVFYPEYSVDARFDVTLTDVDAARTTELYWTELSSVHQGAIPAERSNDGTIKALPSHIYYPVRFALDGTGQDVPDFIARGTVRLQAKPTSRMQILLKRALSVVIREGGF